MHIDAYAAVVDHKKGLDEIGMFFFVQIF